MDDVYIKFIFVHPDKSRYTQSEIHNRKQWIITQYSVVHDAQLPHAFLYCLL